MSKPKRQDATCPACAHTQKEYVEATSTFCHACGNRYSLLKAAPRRMTKSAKTASKLHRRTIECMHCAHPLQIPDASDSWQCPFCSEYLDLKDHTISGSSGRSLLTYGDILVDHHGSFRGNRVEGKNIRIAGGGVSGQVLARKLLEITKPSRVNADLKAEHFHVSPGAGMDSRKSLRCQDAVIEGAVRFREVHISETLTIKAGGKLHTEELYADSIKVEPGGSLIATHAHCTCKQKPTHTHEALSPEKPPVQTETTKPQATT